MLKRQRLQLATDGELACGQMGRGGARDRSPVVSTRLRRSRSGARRTGLEDRCPARCRSGAKLRPGFGLRSRLALRVMLQSSRCLFLDVCARDQLQLFLCALRRRRPTLPEWWHVHPDHDHDGRRHVSAVSGLQVAVCLNPHRRPVARRRGRTSAICPTRRGLEAVLLHL